uniref:C2H2-type domain-containing protein n=1 Tax=Fagus sylvatica TaxID=28930 RepID=A0A2N9HDN9_FAGSY
MDAQARKKAVFRARLNAQKKEKRIDSPLVRYNELEQPVCRVCDVVLKSESHWDAHQVSRKHHEAINTIKASAAGLTRANNVKAEPHKELIKSKPERSTELHSFKPERSTESQKNQSSSVLPPDFFDNNEMKKQKTGHLGELGYFSQHVGYRVGAGNRVQLWHDRWCGDVPLREVYPNLFDCSSNQEDTIDFVLQCQIGGVAWNVSFNRNFNDWEMEDVAAFLDHLYSHTPANSDNDVVWWRLKKNGLFDFRSFYYAIRGSPMVIFPWKSVWCSKVPRRNHNISLSLMVTLPHPQTLATAPPRPPIQPQGFLWWCGGGGCSGFVRRCVKWDSEEGDLALEAEILEFMKDSKNPYAFPSKKELVEAWEDGFAAMKICIESPSLSSSYERDIGMVETLRVSLRTLLMEAGDEQARWAHMGWQWKGFHLLIDVLLGKDSLKSAEPDLYKKTGASAQPEESSSLNLVSEIDRMPSGNVGKAINIQSAGEYTPASEEIAGSKIKQAKGALPEGFFDNKEADLRARGITLVKPDIKDEYKEFEKLIQENLQEVDDRFEEEEIDAAEMIEEAESVEQKAYREKVEMLRKKKLELQAVRSVKRSRVSEGVGKKSRHEESSSDDDGDENFAVDWRAQHL